MAASQSLHRQVVRALIVLVALIGIVSIAVQVSTAEDGIFHIDLHDDGTMSPETEPPTGEPAIERYIEANYSEFGGTRYFKRWVEVGTWTSAQRATDLDVTLESVNLWYRLVQEDGIDAEPSFRITVTVDGEVQLQEDYLFEDLGTSEVFELFDETDDLDLYIMNGSELVVRFDYIGYEDLVLYLDNATYDSGMGLFADQPLVWDGEASGRHVSLECYDAFGSDWGTVAQFFEVFVDGERVEVVSIETIPGKTRDVNGTEVIPTRVTLTLSEELEVGLVADVWVKYTMADASEDIGRRVNIVVEAVPIPVVEFVDVPDVAPSDVSPTMLVVVMAFSMSIAGAFAGLTTERGRWWFFLGFVVPLLSRIKPGELDEPDKFKAGRLYQTIVMNPGINLTDVKRLTGLKNGTSIYHLRRLEEDGLIVSKKLGHLRLFYSTSSQKGDELANRIRYLRHTQRSILQAIADNPNSTQSFLADHLGMTYQTISYHLRELMRLDYIRRSGFHRFYTYRVRDGLRGRLSGPLES